MTSPSTRQRPLLGIALVIAASACFAMMDTTVRFIGTSFGVALVLWVRYALHAAVMAAWIGVAPARSFRTANPMFQIARGTLLAFASAMAFAALRRMPVAEFTAIVMLTPIAATLLARAWLKEPVSRLRWVLVAGGFVGALIVIRPGSDIVGWAALMPLAATIANAGFQVMTTRYAPHENAFTTNFYTGAVGVAIATPILLASTAHPIADLSAAPLAALVGLACVAMLGTGGHLLLIMGLGQAPAATLMPFLYVQLAVAVAAGWVAFRAVPDGWGLVGMGVIGICGALSAWLNIREAAARRRPVTAVSADTVGD